MDAAKKAADAAAEAARPSLEIFARDCFAREEASRPEGSGEEGTLRLKTFWNVVKGMGSLKIGDGVMFKVRNNYDPELDGEGDVFWEPFVEEFSALLKDAHVEEEPEEDAAADWCELLDLEGEAFWYNKRSCQVQLGRPANL